MEPDDHLQFPNYFFHIYYLTSFVSGNNYFITQSDNFYYLQLIVAIFS